MSLESPHKSPSGDRIPGAASSPVPQGTLLGHPLGLFLLFMVEMWERFSYYGMRGLLVLYLKQQMDGPNPGRGWSEGDANTLYGWYTGLAYLFPIFGGMIADKFIGTHRSMLTGGTLIAIGHIILGISGLGGLGESQLGMSLFIWGLGVIVLGTGYFKPTVSVMVGQLYEDKDPRRDGAFTIFYMGINLGAFLCAFVCGTLGEKMGWHYGFGAAAVGMILGMLFYLWGRPVYLHGIGDAPRPNATQVATVNLICSLLLAAGFAYLYHNGTVAAGLAAIQGNQTISAAVGVVVSLAIVTWGVMFVRKNAPEDRKPVISIFLFMLFNVVFWIAFEQAGSSLNVFTKESTDRVIPGMNFEVPATWFQSVNAGLIFLLAPLFSLIWTGLDKRKMNPSQPMKIALGLLFVGVGYVFAVWAGRIAAAPDTKASMIFILATYFWHTVGELCVSPTGLSYVSKTAPRQYVSLLMGLWFVSSFIANLGGGLIAAKVEAIESGQIQLPWHFGGRADFFFLFVLSSFVAGICIMIGTPWLKKLMRPDVQ